MGAIATRFKFKAEETENCEGEEDKAISNKKDIFSCEMG